MIVTVKQQRPYPAFTITRRAQDSCEAGHPWVYDTEVLDPPAHENGELVDLFNNRGRYVGTGLVSDR